MTFPPLLLQMSPFISFSCYSTFPNELAQLFQILRFWPASRSVWLADCWLGALASAGSPGGQLVSERLAGPWLHGRSQAANRRQDSGSGSWSSAPFKHFSRSLQNVVNSGGNWGLDKTTTGRQKLGTWHLFILCLKWFNLAREEQAHLFPHPWNTFPLDNAYTRKLKSWIITGFIYMYFLALIYDTVFLGLDCISSAFSNTDSFN